jgi:transposase-like protein
MNNRLHKNARTPPAIRRETQAATGSDYEQAERFGVIPQTLRKWRKRTTQDDFSHTAHRLQTTLNAGQKALVVELRKTLRTSLDGLLSVAREFIHASMSRSALDRLLRRRGVSRLSVEEAPARLMKAFRAH